MGVSEAQQPTAGASGRLWTEREERFMQAALQQAMKARREDEVPVGCIIVYEDEVIGEGCNRTNATRNGTRHAEFEAIDQVLAAHGDAARGMFPKCELFVTCEPCIMCAGALATVCMGRVVYGCANDKFGGNSSILNIHEDSCGVCCGEETGGNASGVGAWGGPTPYPSEGGLFRDEAVELLREFYVSGNPKAPKPHRKVRQRSIDYHATGSL